ncbi:Protein of unknown function [Pyronema omphalodes CBS 100304]|uniref:Uncharacterized protein n=1 Tax=Pyronema omphalodes (strain CBS 100304) TaxID=1076935 RepID=U4LAS3_PYROM|nr:Protein of unknown function [Pyronema omphalodes CBS 100304]
MAVRRYRWARKVELFRQLRSR